MHDSALATPNDSRSRFVEIALLFGLWAALLPLSATALMIDDFENGTFSISDTTPAGPGVLDSQGGLAGVLGGSRESNISLISGASASLAVSGGVATASAGSPASSFFRFGYDGTPNGIFDDTGTYTIDLTDGGNDRFRLDVIFLIGSIDLTIGISEPGTSVVVVETFTVSSTGTLDILFADFPALADFTNVDSILLQSAGGPVFTNGERISLGSFEAVPEPGTALLLAGGLAGLAAGRRISRR